MKKGLILILLILLINDNATINGMTTSTRRIGQTITSPRPFQYRYIRPENAHKLQLNKIDSQVPDKAQPLLEKNPKNKPKAIVSLKTFLEKNNQEEVTILLNKLVPTNNKVEQDDQEKVNIILNKIILINNGFNELSEFIEILNLVISVGAGDFSTIIKKILTWTKNSSTEFHNLPADQQKQLITLLQETESAPSIIMNIFRIIRDEAVKQAKKFFTKKADETADQKEAADTKE